MASVSYTPLSNASLVLYVTRIIASASMGMGSFISYQLLKTVDICCMYCLSDVAAAGAGADIAEFGDSSSDQTVSVVRGNTAIINCNVPPSIPSPPVIRYLRDRRPFTLKRTLAIRLVCD